MNGGTIQARLHWGLPRLFADLVAAIPGAWSQTVGQQVEHLEFGVGVVRTVDCRRPTLVSVHMEFPGGVREACHPLSFTTGIYSAMTVPPFLGKIEGLSATYRRLPSTSCVPGVGLAASESPAEPPAEDPDLVGLVKSAWMKIARKQTAEVERIIDEHRQRESERRRLAYRRRMAPVAEKNMALQFRRDFLGAEDTCQRQYSAALTRKDYETLRASFVEEWMKVNLSEADTPDRSQLDAIGAVNGNIQVVARAGSGKTFCLVNRARFLQQHCGVRPEQMLLLAFNRDAAQEIRGRLTEAGLPKVPHVLTFHALAHSLVHPQEELLFDDPFGSTELSHTVQAVIDDSREDPQCADRIRAVMMRYFAEDWGRLSEGGFHLSGPEMLQFRRALGREGIDGRVYKSQGEKLIADFLFEHGIPFAYEHFRRWKDRGYRPDFTVFKSDCGPAKDVVIEYFGLEGDPEYDRMTSAKRAYWKTQTDSLFLEITSADLHAMQEAGLARAMTRKLEAVGIACVRLSDEAVWTLIKRRAVDDFSRAVVRAIQHARKRLLTPDELAGLITAHGCTSAERAFLELALEFYDKYLVRLRETDKDDFDGLMQRAIEAVTQQQTLFSNRRGAGDLKGIRYILVDEYQDFSELFHRLVEAILGQNPEVEFFCVGDDWQAIYGWAGADLRFYRDFDVSFASSVRIEATNNYRSAEAVVHASNALMRGRGTPARAADVSRPGHAVVADLERYVPSVREEERFGGDRLFPAILRLVGQSINYGHNVMLLSRTNWMPRYLQAQEDREARESMEQFLSRIRKQMRRTDRSRVKWSTVHKAKGLEEDVVIVIDGLEQRYPLVHPHWIFDRVFGASLDEIVAEERRLLYVAMTRARHWLFIVTEQGRSSPFLDSDVAGALETLTWSTCPPVLDGEDRTTIVIRSEPGSRTREGGTYAIRHLLRAEGFKWRDMREVWSRSVVRDRLDARTYLESTAWVSRADGVRVAFVDGADNPLAEWSIVNGGIGPPISGVVNDALRGNL